MRSKILWDTQILMFDFRVIRNYVRDGYFVNNVLSHFMENYLSFYGNIMDQ